MDNTLLGSPDKDIEQFWYGIKEAVSNYISVHNIECNIENMSEKLNHLQKKKDYDQIEIEIRYNIGRFCYLYIKNGCPSHDSYILLSNIKRWNQLSKKYMFHEKTDIRCINHSCALFSIYVKYLSTKKYHQYTELKDYFSQIQYENYEFEKLIDISIAHKLFQYLDILLPVFNVIDYINKLYNTSLHKNTRGIKILAQLDKMLDNN